MTSRFSTAMRAAVAGSGQSLAALSRQLRARGTPASVSTLSSWQTGENHPERTASVAALASLEVVLGLPARTLIGLLPPRRRRGRWRPPGSTTLPHQRMWRSPEAVERVLARLDATPDDLYIPARVSRTMKVYLDADGSERETRHRHLLRGDVRPVSRLITILRSASLPQPPTIFAAEGCRPGRGKADVPGLLSAFELLLDSPLGPGELRQVEFGIRFPPGQRECHADLRVPPGMRDIVLQVTFDRAQPPARCFGWYQAARGRPEQVALELVSAGDGATFQWVVLDPAPGIYGVRWEW